MSTSTLEMSSVVFTPAAAGKVAELIAEEGNDQLKLRVYVTGGGCSGFQYGFSFDEVANDDDLSPDHWIALTPPRIPNLRSLQDVVGSQDPVLLDWAVPSVPRIRYRLAVTGSVRATGTQPPGWLSRSRVPW